MAYEIFVVIPNVPGESQVDRLVDIRNHTVTTTPIDALSLSVSDTTPVTFSGGGQAVGKPSISDFHITKKIDKASVVLFRTALKGTPLDTVQVIVARSGAQLQVFEQYDLTKVYVQEVDHALTTGDAVQSERITLVPVVIRYSYVVQNADGSRSTVQSTSYDRSTGVIT